MDSFIVILIIVMLHVCMQNILVLMVSVIMLSVAMLNVMVPTTNAQSKPGNTAIRESLSTVDLLELTSLAKLFLLKILFTFLPKQAALVRRSTVLSLPLS